MRNEKQQTASDEIRLRDIVDFLKRNYRLIVGVGVAGLLFSAAYVLVVPNKYEASWQMQMSQFVNSNSNSNSISISNSNTEEPGALTQRLRMPTAYPVEVQQACGMPDGGEFGDYLNGKLKLERIKNVPNAVGMKVRASSPEQAKQCADAIVAMVVAQQNGLIEERLAGRQEQLLQYQQAMREEQQQLERIGKSELGNLGLLARLDKLGWLRGRIAALQEEILLSHKYPAKLDAPIYVSSKPVSPGVGLLLLLGVSLGFMLGALFALGREGWRKVA